MLAGDFDAGMADYERLATMHAAEPMGDYWWQRFLDAAEYADDDVTDEIVEASGRVLAKNPHPALESRMREYRLLVARGKAQLDEAEKEALALGFVRDWFLCGPFDNESESGFKAEYGPEKEFALGGSFEGKHGKNRFFRSAAWARFGTVDLSGLFRMNADVCAYAAAYVKAEKTTPVALRLASDGATKVWVNGTLALGSDCYRRMGFDQDAAGATLEAGWNVILVKVCQKGGGEDTKDLIDTTWEFSLRLTHPDGRKLDGWSAESDIEKAKALKTAAASGAAAPEVDRGAEGALVAAVKAGAGAHAKARLAFLKHRRQALDENDRGARDLLREAVEERDDIATFHLWLGEVEDTKNIRIRHIRRAIELAPDSPLAWWMEAEQHAGAIDDKALASYRKALAARRIVLAEMSVAELYARRGGVWVNEAKRIYQDILKRFPGHGVTQSAMARLSQAQPGEAVKYLEGRLASWGLDENVRGQLVRVHRQMGEFDKAVALLDRRLDLDPFDVRAHLLAGEIYESRGQNDRALERYRAALEIAPENNGALLAAANCCVAAEKPDEAIRYLQLSLAARPNQPETMKRLRSLQPKVVEFWRGWDVALAPHIEAAKALKKEGDEGATYAFKHDVIRVNENGTANYYTQQVIKIHDQRGAQSYRRMSALGGHFDTFSGGRAEFRTAKRIRPDGTVVEGQRREGSWIAGFENLAAGDVVVVEFQMEESGEPRYKGYFGLLLPLQPEFDPVRSARVTFVHPETKKVYFEAVRVVGNPEVSAKDGLVTTTWEMQGVPHVAQEPNMPAFYENVPYIHFSTFQTWQDVGDWFSGLVRDQFEASPEIKDAVRKATGGSKTRAEKIESIFQLLVSRTRYEALGLENHAYLPFKASETFARQYGDCKDTATLFVTMMREAGEEAKLVLVRTNDLGVIDTKLPSMKVFNHCIAWVPDAGDGRPMFVDGTARYYGVKDLPSMDQGAVVFVVKTDGKAAAGVSEWLGPEANTTDSEIHVRINPDGSATLTQKGRLNGMQAGSMRSRYQEGAKREKLFAEWLNRYFDSVEIEQLTFNDLSNYNAPVEFEAKARIPRFARKEGRSLVFRSSLFPQDLADEYGQLAERRHDVVMDFPRVRNQKITFELPPGYKAKSLPGAVDRENAMGAFSWKAKAEGNRIEVETSTTMKTARIPKAEYGQFRDFAVTVDKAEEEEVTIEPEK
jgi:tetratricopeptide (TPR) repeat protein/transglutaminase-like putative cysteine protease